MGKCFDSNLASLNYDVYFTLYINNEVFSTLQEKAIQRKGELSMNFLLYLPFCKNTYLRFTEMDFVLKNEFMFKSYSVEQDSYGVYSLQYSIKLFNETAK
jgi:hypothetical protein